MAEDRNIVRNAFDEGTTSLTDLLTAAQNAVLAINSLNTTMKNVFPQASTVSTAAATAGTITYTSSQAAAFLSVLTSSGATYKVALYT